VEQVNVEVRMDNLIGKTLGQYRIVELAGQGGMATVYKAYQPSLGRYVALKVLPEYLAHDTEFVSRFKQEATAAAALRHPNILVIHDIGEADNLHYIATEFLEGQTLEQVLKQSGAQPLPRVVKIVQQLASALDTAHQHGLIHRDVKPSNVFIGPRDHVTLTDFGIVKAMSATRLTRTGMLVGTPEYMSPEQAEGQSLDWRSDLYSLGVVVYEMLTGQAPFSAPTPNAVLYAHVNKPPALLSQLNPAIPKPVEEIVLRALAKRPDDRFQSVAEFAAALEQVARLAEGNLAAGLYREAHRLASQSMFAEAQIKLDQLRQINPSYPGLPELATEIARQAQIAREYGEIVQLARQARERAADLARRAPGHPDPERVLKPPAPVTVARSGGSGWTVMWVAGLALVIGGVLGFWAIPAEGRSAWGASVLFSGLLGRAIVAPWVTLIGVVLAAGMGILAALVSHKLISRGLALAGAAVVALGFVLTVILARSMGVEGPGPTVALVGQIMLAIGLAASFGRGA
jgi:serine/threonine protein kinase